MSFCILSLYSTMSPIYALVDYGWLVNKRRGRDFIRPVAFHLSAMLFFLSWLQVGGNAHVAGRRQIIHQDAHHPIGGCGDCTVDLNGPIRDTSGRASIESRMSAGARCPASFVHKHAARMSIHDTARPHSMGSTDSLSRPVGKQPHSLLAHRTLRTILTTVAMTLACVGDSCE